MRKKFLKKLKGEIMNMFTIDDKQATQIKKWKKEHKCSLRTSDRGIEEEIYVGAIGGAITYCFTPTGIGIIVEAKCACGEKLNVTDFEDW